MFAYGALAVACLLSIYAFFKSKALSWSSIDFLLHLGVSLMGIGLLFGALWAKTAWGNFWRFDLKETWAAIAWLAFIGVLHYRYVYEKHRKSGAVLVIMAFLLLQMCWFGVNYLPTMLRSLHRY
jgi:ABC-type transport system involved in cytochrome c biogenesis permease subunit